MASRSGDDKVPFSLSFPRVVGAVLAAGFDLRLMSHEVNPVSTDNTGTAFEASRPSKNRLRDLVNREVSPAEDEREPEFMNVHVDRERYAKLLILVALWNQDSPAQMVQDYIDNTWEELGDGIPMDLTSQDFREVAKDLLELEG